MTKQTPEQIAAHFDGDALKIDAAQPFRLVVTIDNDDREQWSDNPFTLNAQIGGDPEYLALGGGGGALIDGTVPDQLRALAALIEAGEVRR